MFNIYTAKPAIIATLGPSSESKEIMLAMIKNGMTVARFNFSHADHRVHEQRLETLRQVAEEAGIQISVFADLSGPKVRIGQLEKESCELREGELFVLTSNSAIGNERIASVQFKGFGEGLAPGMHILIDDGKILLEVLENKEEQVVTRVIRGGILFPEKGVNIPEGLGSLVRLTEKDKSDALFAIKQGYDAIATSFIRKKEDIQEMRNFLKEHGGSSIAIIAKLETLEAMRNLEAIIQETDVVMVARGDLGVEIGIEHVPMYQKKICEIAKKYNKPVIIATQILESMVESKVPTRAEVSDAVNAILDGASYLMLSDETTTGKHPAESVLELTTIVNEYNKINA